MTNGESGTIDASQRVEKAGQQDHCRVLPSVVCRIEQNSAGASAPRSAERGLSNREIISRRYAATFRRTRLVSPRNVQPALLRHVPPNAACQTAKSSAGATPPRSAERGLSVRATFSRRFCATFRRTRLVSPRNVQPALRRHVRGENSRMIGKTSSRPASMARESSSLDAGE